MIPVIRSATAADIGDLARLRWQLYTEQGPHDEPFETYVDRFTAFAADALSRDGWRAWVADVDGHLTNAYVESAHRSQGLGSRMLQAVVSHCEAAGFVLVMAWPADDAYRFYERNGFTRPPDPVVRRLEP